MSSGICFKYREDRLPVFCISLLFLLDLFVYATVQNIGILITWMLLGLGPKACICAWNHHHQHVATFKQTWLNRLLELVYAFHTGITTNAWVLHHNLGHHLNYLDQTKDESAWRRPDGTDMGCFEYTMTIAATGYLRAYKVGKKHPKFQKPFKNMGILVVALLALLFYYNWLNALIVFFVPMTAGYVITCWHTYYHHAGLDTDDHLEASYNIMHRWYNRLTGNLGYHTAHHMKQGLHWSKLPDYHEEIKAGIPEHLYRPPCIPFKWMPAS